MGTTPVLACGTYLLNLQCPHCQAVQEVAVFLDTQLTEDSTGAKLSGKLRGKPVDHLCGQMRLVTANGEAAPEAVEAGLFTEPDPRKRAAGDMT